MPPPLALTLTLIFIGWLFWEESRLAYKPSPALWITSIWLLILGSRSVTEWVYLGTPVAGGDIAEGSPLDRAVFFSLIVAGVVVLAKRRISWSQLFRENVWLTIFFVYSGISLVWSDFPFVGFKRWTKAFGDPIMALIVLTDKEPIQALKRVAKICAYFLFPLSVLFIKYYPHLGRGFSEWTGAAYSTGVTLNKNILGCDMMVFGLFLIWIIVSVRKVNGNAKGWLNHVRGPVLMLCMVAWLFTVTDSKTPLVCFLIGLLTFWALGMKNVRVYLGAYILAGLIVFAALESLFDLTRVIIEGAGRDATLTGRTEVWETVIRMQEHPVLGYGFESFWLGDRLKKLQNMWGYFKPTQSHNGYIEMYMNLGYVGLVLMAGVILACYAKMYRMLNSKSAKTEDVLLGRTGMAFLLIYLFYNYTEAAFKSLHLMYVLLLLFTICSIRLTQENLQSAPRVSAITRKVSSPVKVGMSA